MRIWSAIVIIMVNCIKMNEISCIYKIMHEYILAFFLPIQFTIHFVTCTKLFFISYLFHISLNFIATVILKTDWNEPFSTSDKKYCIYITSNCKINYNFGLNYITSNCKNETFLYWLLSYSNCLSQNNNKIINYQSELK